jgi:serine protease Do
MRITIYSFFLGAGILLNTNFLFSQQLDYKTLESSIQQVVNKVSVATVAVTSYDSVKESKKGPTFSAVVVNPEGYILTAAHAASANQTYQVVFPDGKKVMAIGLGSIKDIDAAIIKILPAGNWPHAEMGWSSTLVPFQPCISMGYPANMRQTGHPLVRFGYVTESPLNPGYLCNTALMEPGDSGGPLFDMNGRVIGIHSRIAQSMDANFEVPVDAFRKYWNKLIKAEIYYSAKSLDTQKIEPTPVQYLGKSIPALENFHENFSALLSAVESTSLNITSKLKGEENSALGTLISIEKEGISNSSYLISKSSIVGDDSIFVSWKKKTFPAKVIKRDSLNDLVLLEIPSKLTGGVNIISGSFDKEKYSSAGKFLVSPGTNYATARVSVLSTPAISYIPGWNSWFGAFTVEYKNALTIKKLETGSAAMFAKLKKGDRIVSINGVKVKTSEELDWEISTYKPLTNIRLKGKRHGFGFTKNIELKALRVQTAPEHLGEQFEGGKSLRKDGFRKTFIHDARLYPSECGGPVFDAEGNFIGINIARVCRTSSIGIPAEQVRIFVKAALKI